jgi:hypothetical protein
VILPTASPDGSRRPNGNRRSAGSQPWKVPLNQSPSITRLGPIRASGVRIEGIGARPDAAKARIGAPIRRMRSQGADGPRSAPAAILVPRLPLICRIAEDLKTIKHWRGKLFGSLNGSSFVIT